MDSSVPQAAPSWGEVRGAGVGPSCAPRGPTAGSQREKPPGPILRTLGGPTTGL